MSARCAAMCCNIAVMCCVGVWFSLSFFVFVFLWGVVVRLRSTATAVYDIAYEMERLYKATIEKGNDGLRDFEHRKQVAVNPNV